MPKTIKTVTCSACGQDRQLYPDKVIHKTRDQDGLSVWMCIGCLPTRTSQAVTSSAEWLKRFPQKQ